MVARRGAGASETPDEAEQRSAFGRQVRDVLNRLYEPAYLQTHPLTALLPRDAAVHGGGAGKALRQFLVAAIEGLRPIAGASTPSAAGVIHQVLTLRYVEALEPTTVQERLAIGRSEYYREHQHGLDALISLLWARHVGGADTGSPAPAPPLAAQSPVPSAKHNLPTQPTPFVGRAVELGTVTRLLASTPLLTLTGTGGCGKTRLALRAASDLVDDYADGVWLAELAPLADPALIPQTVAAALGVREVSGESIETTLVNYLRHKQLLLVVDNCEHVVDAAARLIDTLIRAAPRLQILATSREALGMAGEVAWRVPSLGLPPQAPLSGGPADGLGAIAGAEAVQLFVSRARAVQPAFALAAQNAGAVSQICRRLDGIPLGIELAAARVRVLRPEQIAARLDDLFRLLTGGSRTALPRQQTLKATIDWSYDLLTDPERAFFRRLAVFAGGWTLEAAEQVCAGGTIEEAAVLDLLTALADKSLVLADERGPELRYYYLEPIRQYARDRLFESGEAALVRDRHRDWAVGLAETAEPALVGPDQLGWFARLDTEYDNLRGALAWCRGSQPRLGLRLAAALWWLWFVRQHLAEGRHWLDEFLGRTAAAESDATTSVLRGRAHLGMAWLAWRQADLDAQLAHAADSLRLLSASDNPTDRCRALWIAAHAATLHGDRARAQGLREECQTLACTTGRAWDTALALSGLGWQAHAEDDRIRSQAYLEQAVSCFRESGDRWGIGDTLARLGANAASLGHHARGRLLLEESLAFARADDNKYTIEWALNILIAVAHAEGDYPRGEALFEECLQLARDRGPFGPALVLGNMGDLARVAGDIPRAKALLSECLTLARDGKNLWVTKFCLGYFGMLALQLDDPERAVCLLAAAATIEIGRGGLFNYERAELETAISTGRATLGEEDFATAWAVGQAMTQEQAIAYALEVAGQ
jgi:non-specific serine/threonine protein kinase